MASRWLKLIFGGGAVGVGLKLMTWIILYHQNWPFFPNVVADFIDASVIISVGLYVVKMNLRR